MVKLSGFKKQIAGIFALKTLHQIIYTLFCFLAIKKLSIEDFGLFSYILAITAYFPSFALLGLPLYAQKQIANNEHINFHYLYIIGILSVLLLIAIQFILPSKIVELHHIIIFITFTNMLMALLTAINNGNGYYINEYKFLLCSCLWMPVIIIYTLYSGTNLTLTMIFYCWNYNCIILLIYLLFSTLSIFKNIKYAKENISSTWIIINLVLLYSFSIPFDFPKFYDRFLLDKFFDHKILGIYAFNSTLVVIAYALFIRPLTNVCITLLSKNLNDLEQQAKILSRYYLHVIITYGMLVAFYAPFSRSWLNLLGLSRYGNTIGIFFFSLFNMFLFSFSIPLQIRICLSNDAYKKLLYCCSSILIFNIPFVFILVHHDFLFFLYGFMFAYLFHFLLCIFLDFEKTKILIKLLPNEFNILFNKAYNLIFDLR